MKQMTRILIELGFQDTLASLDGFNKDRKPIIRKKTYGYEVDFSTNDVSGTVREIRKLFGMVPLRIPEELIPIEKPDIHDVSTVLKNSTLLFIEERYWESHILMETVWRHSSGELKDFIQSLILLAASQVHFQMGEEEIAELQYFRALLRLKNNHYSTYFKLTVSSEFSYPAEIGMSFPPGI